jgi:hypothetical protein
VLFSFGVSFGLRSSPEGISGAKQGSLTTNGQCGHVTDGGEAVFDGWYRDCDVVYIACANTVQQQRRSCGWSASTVQLR